MSVETSAERLQGPSGDRDEPLHVVLRRLVAAVDAGQALPAYLHAAGASQIVADRLQGQVVRPRLLAAAATAARGRTGLTAWHVLLRDLTVVLAEAAVSGSEQETAAILLSVRSSIDGLRRGMSGLAARWHSGALIRLPTAFEKRGLGPQDALALADGFAGLRPDRDRPLLVLGLRSSGAYLAPLVAAALGRLDYRHVVTRTTRAGGPLLPEEPGLPEAVRRVGGLVLPVGAPPRTGSSLATVIATLAGIGFAAGRILPVYPALDEGDRPPVMLHGHTVVALPASRWAHRKGSDEG